MKLFGMLRKEKPVPFPQFRDMVRLAVRRSNPGCTAQNTDNGFILTPTSGRQQECSLRALYADYCKNPGNREVLIQNYIDNLITETPEHGWHEARPLLRPLVKPNDLLALAQREMEKRKSIDSLPAAPFAGDLSVIVVREIPGSVIGVTRVQLDAWGVTFEQALHEAVNNMNMLSFPPVINEMTIGGTSNRRGVVEGGEVVGLVFEGDHLTATWLTLERFRDFLSMKLQGDYVVSVPNRNRLMAVRVDEVGLISSMQQANRNYKSLPYPLTDQCFHINAASTGGVVTVYKETGSASGALDPNSIFAVGNFASSAPNLASEPQMGGFQRPQPVNFGALGELMEPTSEASASNGAQPQRTPWNRGKS